MEQAMTIIRENLMLITIEALLMMIIIAVIITATTVIVTAVPTAAALKAIAAVTFLIIDIAQKNSI